MTDRFKHIRVQDSRLRPRGPNECWSLQVVAVQADGKRDRHLVLVDDFSGEQLASLPVADVSGAGVVRMLDGAVASLPAGPFTIISDLSEALMSKEVVRWAIHRRIDWCRVKMGG